VTITTYALVAADGDVVVGNAVPDLVRRYLTGLGLRLPRLPAGAPEERQQQACGQPRHGASDHFRFR
jgi:hypothetical protein